MGYAPTMRTLLRVRGICSDEDAARFLAPDWERDTHDPFLMRDMERACERIERARVRGERIVLWSDYDMDGIPGAVALSELLSRVGCMNVTHHTPHRNRDGFGLNRAGIDELVAQEVRLIITIDCGIGDHAHVAYARERGVDVIVTDHHIPGEVLPPAYAVLNPKREGCAYPEKMLCGAGVAFKLAHAFLMYLHARADDRTLLPPVAQVKWLLDMVGMATIADRVPLVGENRTLAHFGLIVLRRSRRPGLQALLRTARADQRHLTEDDVGFTIAPRVNAASRMGHASDAFRLLATTDEREAGALADHLDRINTARKTLVASMKREIKRRIARIGEPKEVVVLGNPEWKPSLLGLVAGGLAEEYTRPVFLWGREEGVLIKGSCRSGSEVSVYELMREASEHFLEYGGHARSGGFSLDEERVHTLETALIAAHRRVASSDAEHPRMFDGDLQLEEVTWDLYRSIARLGPFGEGNPKPLFRFCNVSLVGVRSFGKGSEHLELTLARGSNGQCKAISFFTAQTAYRVPLVIGTPTTIIAHLEASHFRGVSELRLRLVDVL